MSSSIELFKSKYIKIYWAIPEKKTGSGIWNSQGYWRNSKWDFQGLIKNNVEFPEVIKKKVVEFLGVLVLGLKISELYNTILWSF